MTSTRVKVRIPELRPWRRFKFSDKNAETIELLLTAVLIMAIALWYASGR